jgi:hypothetical protein
MAAWASAARCDVRRWRARALTAGVATVIVLALVPAAYAAIGEAAFVLLLFLPGAAVAGALVGARIAQPGRSPRSAIAVLCVWMTLLSALVSVWVASNCASTVGAFAPAWCEHGAMVLGVVSLAAALPASLLVSAATVWLVPVIAAAAPHRHRAVAGGMVLVVLLLWGVALADLRGVAALEQSGRVVMDSLLVRFVHPVRLEYAVRNETDQSWIINLDGQRGAVFPEQDGSVRIVSALPPSWSLVLDGGPANPRTPQLLADHESAPGNRVILDVVIAEDGSVNVAVSAP